MADTEYAVRSYCGSDLEAVVRMKVEMANRHAGQGRLAAADARSRLGRPGYAPEERLFVAESREGIAGYLDMHHEPAIGRVVMECLVVDGHRQRGIARRLFLHALPRARALGAAVAHVVVAESETTGRRVLEKAGFRVVRQQHELQIDLSDVVGPGADVGCQIRPLAQGEEGVLCNLQNHCFAGAWGFNPNTPPEVSHALRSGGDDTVLVAEVDRNTVGYVWTGREPDDSPYAWRGRIGMIGVEPRYRGQGIGRALLLAALSLLQGKGYRSVTLTVDSENRAARALYASTGFREVGSSLWYEKPLR